MAFVSTDAWQAGLGSTSSPNQWVFNPFPHGSCVARHPHHRIERDDGADDAREGKGHDRDRLVCLRGMSASVKTTDCSRAVPA